eukprot:6984607-Pyramimonas_sp.AAC.1
MGTRVRLCHQRLGDIGLGVSGARGDSGGERSRIPPAMRSEITPRPMMSTNCPRTTSRCEGTPRWHSLDSTPKAWLLGQCPRPLCAEPEHKSNTLP